MDRTVETPDVLEAAESIQQSQRLFTVSMAVTAVRCVITYVALPFLTPLIGFAPGVGPVLGIVVGAVAIAANAFSMYRFWVLDHRWKVPVSALHVAVIGLMLVLIALDVSQLVVGS